MSEPLDPYTQWRVEETKRIAKLPRRVDLPAVAPDITIGTLHVRPRLPVVRRVPDHHCPICGKGFWPRNTTHIYCQDDCRHKAKLLARRTTPPKIPFNVRPERDRAVAAVCAVWPDVTPGMILGPYRHVPIVRPRHAAYRLTLDGRPGASISDVGRAFNRDHTSILSGLRKHEKLMADPEYAARFREAESRARAALNL